MDDQKQSANETLEISSDLYDKLIRSKVFSQEGGFTFDPEVKIKELSLDQIEMFENGVAFGKYLLVLKSAMSANNQNLNIDEIRMETLKEGSSPDIRKFNWHGICQELDKLGISIDQEVQEQMEQGNKNHIVTAFTRVNGFLTKIAGKKIFDFEPPKEQVVAKHHEHVHHPHPHEHANHPHHPPLKHENTQKGSQKHLDHAPPTHAFEKKNSIMEKKLSHISDTQLKPSLTSMKTQKSNAGEKGTRRGMKVNQKKVVKEAVDILSMKVDKQPHETESSLELILNTLCRACEMKPKQAAALLTNNNQYLIHSAVKGIKGTFQPLLRWFQELNANSRHLSSLIESETEDFPDSANCTKVLQSISCGMYCTNENLEICLWCYRLITKLFEDFRPSQIVFDHAFKWFLDKEGGFELCLHSLANHQYSDVGEEVVNMISQFINGLSEPQERFLQFYKERFQKYFTVSSQYLFAINEMLPYIMKKNIEEINKSQILVFWVDIAIRQADNTGSQMIDERIIALSFLTEIWFNFPDFVDQSNDMSTTLLATLRKVSRERSSAAKIVAISMMFKLLEKFGLEKNRSAPILYKSLIFTFVESSTDIEIRQHYLTNFGQLFKTLTSVPIGLLIDPYLKQMQSDKVLFEYKTFDFEFFKVLTQHPRLSVNMAVSLSDTLAKIFLNEVIFATSVLGQLIDLIQRYISDEEVTPMQEFALKFSSIALRLLLDLEKNANEIKAQFANTQSQKQKAIMPPPVPPKRRNTRPTKESILKDLQDGDLEGARMLKKSLIVGVMQRILQVRNESLNEGIKAELLSVGKQSFQVYGYFNKGILALLAFFSTNPQQLMQSSVNQKNMKGSKLGIVVTSPSQNNSVNGINFDMPIGSPTPSGSAMEGTLQVYKPPMRSSSQQSKVARKSVLALPSTEQSMQGSKLQDYRQRNIEEIDLIKKKKVELVEQKQQEEDRRIIVSQKKKKRMRDMLDKRKVELGVPYIRKPIVAKGGQEPPTDDPVQALIYNEGQLDQQQDKFNNKSLKTQIELIDLSLEEKRDREAIKACMKKHQKLWKNLFSKYANTGFTTKHASNFEQINDKAQNINYPEVIKLLKDHGLLPTYITKEEVNSMFKLINAKSNSQKNDISTLDYAGYQLLIPQIAILSFNRPPKDLSYLPLVESLKTLISIFRDATKERGQSIMLYDDPDIGFLPKSDQQLIKALNEKLQSDPQYPTPEGYMKIVEKTALYDYKIPTDIASILPESKVVAIEVLDSLISQILGFHFLEPLVTFQDLLKVKPMMNAVKPLQAEALLLMSKVEEKKNAKLPKQEEQYFKPKLNLTLQLEVSKKPLSERPSFLEVAEVMEEMLTLLLDKDGVIQNADQHLPSRIRKNPGKTMNEARQKMQDEQKKDTEQSQKDDENRKKRKEQLKQDILKLKEQKDKEAIEEKKKQDEAKAKELAAKKKADEEVKKRSDELKKKIEEAKKAKADEEEKKKKEIDDKQKAEADKRKVAAKEFMKLQKDRLVKEFEQVAKDRETVQEKKVELKKQEAEVDKKIRYAMENYLREEKSQLLKDQSGKENTQIIEFLESQDVAELFNKYDRSLRHMYKFFAAQDKRDWADHNKENMNLREFIRFSYQHRVIPLLIEKPDDAVKLFKQGVKGEGTEQNQFLQLTFEGFKKILVRIAVFAQDNIGGQKEDLLSERMRRDKQDREEERKKKEKLLKQKESKVKEDSQAIEELKNEFMESNKQNIKIKQVDPQKKIYQDMPQEKIYEINENLKAQEEAFFQKWLKVREAKVQKGKSRAQSSSGVGRGEADASKLGTTPLIRKTKEVKILKNLANAGQQVSNLGSLDPQLDNAQKMKALAIKGEFDIKIVSASTISTLFEFLGLESEAHLYDLDRNINQHRMDIQGQRPNKFLKQGTKPVESNYTLLNNHKERADKSQDKSNPRINPGQESRLGRQSLKAPVMSALSFNTGKATPAVNSDLPQEESKQIELPPLKKETTIKKPEVVFEEPIKSERQKKPSVVLEEQPIKKPSAPIIQKPVAVQQEQQIEKPSEPILEKKPPGQSIDDLLVSLDEPKEPEVIPIKPLNTMKVKAEEEEQQEVDQPAEILPEQQNE